MQLGPSACVSCLAVFHAKVLRMLVQVAGNPASASAGRSSSFHQAAASAACSELVIDARRHQDSRGHPAGHAERCAVLSVAFLLMAQPTLSALEMIGRPRGERWDFL